MELVVWNSQGNRWNDFWTRPVSNVITNNAGADVAGFLVEAGWSPWVTPGPVTLNNIYPLNDSATWYDATSAGASAACIGLRQTSRRSALWVPWVASPDAFRTNTRCSMGGLWSLPSLSVLELRRFALSKSQTGKERRPIIRVTFGKNGNAKLTVLLVHLISGYWRAAQKQMDYLVARTRTMIPEGTPALIVGDLNIDLPTRGAQLDVPNKWRILRTNAPTQQSGGELDWGLLYDPAGQLGGASVAQIQQFGNASWQSDHSVLQYSIPV